MEGLSVSLILNGVADGERAIQDSYPVGSSSMGIAISGLLQFSVAEVSTNEVLDPT
jgi:hypothetical protein